MNLKKDILKDLKEAMKEGDTVKRDTLRMLDSMIKNAEIKKGKRETGLDEEEIQTIIARAIKQRKEAIMQYVSGGRDDLAQKEKQELEVLTVYQPQQLTEDEIKKIVKKVIAETGVRSLSGLGQVMGLSMKQLKGKADGEAVRKIVQAELK